MPQISSVLQTIAIAVDLVSIAILVLAAIKFVIHFLGLEFRQLRGIAGAEGIRDLRLGLGSYILLSLEFTIIADIIHTALSRDLENLKALGLLVLIRIALSFFLGRELYDVKKST